PREIADLPLSAPAATATRNCRIGACGRPAVPMSSVALCAGRSKPASLPEGMHGIISVEVAALVDRLGEYEIQRRLATGGMAEILLARRTGPEGFARLVAVKRILPCFASEQGFVARFLEEARVAAKLYHANIVQVFDVGTSEGMPYLAMELLRGLDLGELQ